MERADLIGSYAMDIDSELSVGNGAQAWTIQLRDSDVLVFKNAAGQEVAIDFRGDAVTYSGYLPVDESARLFFDIVFGYLKQEANQCQT
jgi:hypothetical protein